MKQVSKRCAVCGKPGTLKEHLQASYVADKPATIKEARRAKAIRERTRKHYRVNPEAETP